MQRRPFRLGQAVSGGVACADDGHGEGVDGEDLAEVSRHLDSREVPFEPRGDGSGGSEEGGVPLSEKIASGEVDMDSAFNNEVANGQQRGAPIAMQFNGALYTTNSWVILKGTPNNGNKALRKTSPLMFHFCRSAVAKLKYWLE